MAYKYLITSADFVNVREISSNVAMTARLNPYIQEAQEFDIKPILGEVMYFDLLKNSSETNYSNLLAGKEYIYENYTYQFIGLKTIIAYYAYARFIQNDQIKSTPTGFVTKTNEYSERITKSEIDRIVSQAESAAFAYCEDMRLFLARNQTSYPKWAVSSNRVENKRKVNFSTIKKQ